VGGAFLVEALFPAADAALAEAAALRESRRIRIARFISSRVGGFSVPGAIRNLNALIKVWFSGDRAI